MSLKIEIDSWDYKEACKAVQNLLNGIEILSVDGDNAKIVGLPSAAEIVDSVWDAIK